jgi:hypothetical protein
MGNESAQSSILDTMWESQSDVEEKRQIRLAKVKERSRSSRSNETEEQRHIRLEKVREQTRSSRTNETEEQRQIRLEKVREQTRFNRTNETEEQRQIRLEQQRKRNQANRTKKKLEKRASDNTVAQNPNNDMQLNETEDYALYGDDSIGDLTRSKLVTKKKKSFISPPWPEPISHDLKETCLQRFLQRMSMSTLAEVTCAVCNVRTPVQKSKKIPTSKIPHVHLLKVSNELNDLIINNQSSNIQNSNGNNIRMTEHVEGNMSFFKLANLYTSFNYFRSFNLEFTIFLL